MPHSSDALTPVSYRVIMIARFRLARNSVRSKSRLHTFRRAWICRSVGGWIAFGLGLTILILARGGVLEVTFLYYPAKQMPEGSVVMVQRVVASFLPWRSRMAAREAPPVCLSRCITQELPDVPFIEEPRIIWPALLVGVPKKASEDLLVVSHRMGWLPLGCLGQDEAFDKIVRWDWMWFSYSFSHLSFWDPP